MRHTFILATGLALLTTFITHGTRAQESVAPAATVPAASATSPVDAAIPEEMTTAPPAPPSEPTPSPAVAATPYIAPSTPVLPGAPPSDSAEALEPDGAKSMVPLQPGFHFGVSARIFTAGALRIRMADSDEFEHTGMANTAGFELFLEKVTDGGVVAPGLGLRVDFPKWTEWESTEFPLGAEIQIDFRLRLYMSRTALFRPYLQGALGLSIGVSNSFFNDSYPVAIGLNGAGSAGIALAPRNSRAAFFFDVGMQSTQFWAPETTDSSGDGDTAIGAVRYLVMSIGVEI